MSVRDVGSERSTELTCGATGSGLRGVNLCHRIRREIELKSVAVTPKRFVTSDSTIRSGIPSQTRVDDRRATDPEKASTALSSILPSWWTPPIAHGQLTSNIRQCLKQCEVREERRRPSGPARTARVALRPIKSCPSPMLTKAPLSGKVRNFLLLQAVNIA